MQEQSKLFRIAIIGGGPTGLLTFKRFLAYGANKNLAVDVFERKQILGAGMPYSRDGALDEHITNVSGNEIPEFERSVEEWVQTEDQDTLNRFKIDPDHFNDYKVLPRLLFGRYLSDQFKSLIKQARSEKIEVNVRYGSEVVDIIDDPKNGITTVIEGKGEKFQFDRVIICSGHHWPEKLEGKIKNYYDSPYPPTKLAHRTNHEVAIRGSSLTAIDALRTLSRNNGKFKKNENGELIYSLDKDSPHFKMVMHSKNGFLPAVRFHLEDSHLSKGSVLSHEEVAKIRAENDGFMPLNYVYKRNFLEPLAKADPEFHREIASLSIEEFVDKMMGMRENRNAFNLLEEEYKEAEKSIKKRESIDWKEMLAVLSFAMNYPAKHFSAEDMQRLKKTLMPLISVVIAFAPQASVEEMLALHQAGVLDIVSVGEDSKIEPREEGGIVYSYYDESDHKVSKVYNTFVDAIGQPHLEMKDIPYPSLISEGVFTAAKLKFNSRIIAKKQVSQGNEDVMKFNDGEYYLKVPGIAINDNFQVLDAYGAANERIYMLAVPYIGGYNPDYSGLDFGEAASEKIVSAIFNA
ncbi:MAG: hypothetical protein EOO90_10155 [Pedobacter sp.]|nr:MAG: hypothetical protein EOO90_10155 [Pedobacter sp.]